MVDVVKIVLGNHFIPLLLFALLVCVLCDQTEMQLRPSPTDVLSVVRDVVNRCRNSMRPSIRFLCVTGNNTPKVPINIDQGHLRMVWSVINLIVAVLCRCHDGVDLLTFLDNRC